MPSAPAAFGRLRVETGLPILSHAKMFQPPSGGCVLKLYLSPETGDIGHQPPSGGCVLKHSTIRQGWKHYHSQPPSGGCVLKQFLAFAVGNEFNPAAFGRLRVETPKPPINSKFRIQPPSGGCVLKQRLRRFGQPMKLPSRLRAAAC